MPEGPFLTGPPEDRTRYTVEDPDGIAGGEALVFYAHRRSDGLPVALKQLPIADAARKQRLLTRAGEVAELRHPHVVQHLETFLGPGLFRGTPPEEDTDVLYLASAWVPGVPLSDVPTPLTPSRALDVLRQLAEAVDHLHARGVTHRDLHPGNVVLREDSGSVVVIDLAHTRPRDAAGTTVVYGARGFVPPERYDDPSSTDPASDRWQVAMIGVHLLLGRVRRREPLRDLEHTLAGALTGAVPSPAASAAALVAMLADVPEQRPGGSLASWAEQVRGATGAPRRRRGAVLAALCAAAVGIAVVVTAVATSDPDAAPPTPAARACDIPVGQPDAAAPPAPDRVAEVVALSRTGTAGCPTTPVVRYGEMAVQEFGSPEIGALVSSGPGSSFVLSPAQWGGYHQIGGKDGSQAAGVAGEIRAVEVDPSGSVVRTRTGELRATRADNPHFFVPQVVGAVVRTRSDLGAVTSNVRFQGGTVLQDFERGVVVLTGGTGLRVQLIADPAAELPPEDLRRRIVRSPDATSWYVDENRVRHWIDTGAEYQCLGGKAIAIPTDVPSYAVASLPDGGPARCPS